jgi:hypothetical protein
MSFFDTLIETPTYQAKALANTSVAPQQAGIPAPAPQMPMQPPMGYAKGGLTSANENITQIQIMKVFRNYFENLGVDVEQGMKNLQKEIDQGLELIPFESSVMGYKPLGESTAQIHFFTVGTLEDLANDMRYFYKYLKNQGVKTVYDTLPAPITTQMFVTLGAKVEESDNPKYKLKATI